jgi:putative membrane protein
MTTALSSARGALFAYPREFLAIAAWLMAMIAFPIAYWTIGPEVIPVCITIAAIAQGVAVYVALSSRFGWGALYYLAAIAAMTWLAEAVGSRTGVPFGEYQYTDVLQPQIGGVPALIPFAWFMMLPPAWAVTQIILGNPVGRPTLRYRTTFAAVSALALTAWDLFLDPQMVGWNFWQWAHPVGYFGIPWSNYVGWLIVSFLVSFVLCPPALPKLPLVAIYACVWFLQSVGLALFWGMPGPALVGSVAMAAMMMWAYLRWRAA